MPHRPGGDASDKHLGSKLQNVGGLRHQASVETFIDVAMKEPFMCPQPTGYSVCMGSQCFE